MPGTVIQTSLGLGFAGAPGRNGFKEIAARQVTPTDTLPVFFGDPVVMLGNSTGGTYSSVAAYIAASGTFTAAKFGGIAVRNVKSFETYIASGNSSPTNASFTPGQPADVMKRGNIIVKCLVGTPVAGGSVYVRVVLNGAFPAGVVGGFEAASDGSNTVVVPNAQWFSGVLDADFLAEIELIAVTLV